ncbi:MAG: monovalent cation/H+ antiporter subunit D, partial [Paracoccaceae bacterium]
MTDHLIILPVVLPAMLAPLIVLAIRHDLAMQRIVALAGTLVLVALSVWLLVTATEGPQVYRLGDWPAPFGIVLVLDRLAAMMVALTSVLALFVQLYAIGTGWDARGKHFHALFAFQLMGLNGAFLTGDAFNLFVFFEVLLIASYGLMIHGAGQDRLRAGIQYVGFNLIGSTLFLFGLATIYAVTGTLNMADLAIKVAALPPGDAALLRVAGLLMLMVFAIKAALVPFQFWLPGTYANAPGPVAALFAIMTKVGAYAVIRMFTLVFSPTVAAIGTLFADLLLPAALVTLFIGAFGTLGAHNLPRLTAFAGIASMGTIFLAIAAFTPQATTSALYYLIHSTLTGALLFLIADLVAHHRGNTSLRTVLPPMAQGGLIASLFLIAAIGMAGMPPLSGFLGKLLIMDALRDQALLVWPTILITSLLLILGFARAGSTLFWKAHTSDAPPQDHPSQALALTAVFLLIAGLVALTIFAGPVTEWLGGTARQLHD